MKRTYNINMGQRLFVIDEDAYNLMTEYLDTLRHLFDNTPGQEETAADLETRAAELFTEYLAETGSPSISLEQVQEVITRLGKPEEIVEIEEETISSAQEQDQVPPQTPPPYVEETPIKKRLFRNPQDRVIGGLCSGLAIYLGVNVVVVRVIAVLLALFSLSTVAIIYVVGCFVIPEARTPLERMQMYGEMPTLANIGRNMTNMMSSAYGSLKSQTNDPESGLSKFMKALGKGLLILLMGLLGIGIIGCSIAMVVLFGLCIADLLGSLFPAFQFVGSWDMFISNLTGKDFFENAGAMFVLISVLIPVGMLEYVLFGVVNNTPAMKLKTFISWLVLLVFTITASCLLLH